MDPTLAKVLSYHVVFVRKHPIQNIYLGEVLHIPSVHPNARA